MAAPLYSWYYGGGPERTKTTHHVGGASSGLPSTIEIRKLMKMARGFLHGPSARVVGVDQMS